MRLRERVRPVPSVSLGSRASLSITADGPQAWVHLAVFIAVALCAIRTFRLIGADMPVSVADRASERSRSGAA
jgi:hypothetical protein